MKKEKPVRKKENAFKTVLRGFFALLGGLFKLLWFLGLWVPLLYALFGAVLHFTLGFDPFDFSFYSTLYIVGGIVCIVITLIVAINHAFIHPLKKVFSKKKKPAAPTREETLQPPLSSDSTPPAPPQKPTEDRKKKPRIHVSDLHAEDLRSIPNYPGEEIPQVYFSVIQPDILVHEYKDRFELYRIEGTQLVSAGTEYKNQ